jgi:UDP-N-acetylmuramate dehydrogenase
MNRTLHADLPQLAPEFNARVLHEVPMSKHTSWHAGGPADLFFTPRDATDLASFLRQLPPSVPMLWIGLGSNLLVRDGGVRGAVVVTHGALGALERVSATRIYAEAGVPCARIARQCVKWGLGPAEFFAGIPGTLGGALAMNAGAWGGETWRHVVEVDVLDRGGTRHTRTPADYDIGYRHVRGPADEWFIAARMEFERKPGANEAAIRELLEKRKQTQPIGEWSCGSVFTNPPGDHAARLIESAGLKGFRIGDASVSEKHANFIINHGAARAADIEAVILHVQRTVAAVHHIDLTTEVRIVGDPA